jgi:tetratricopeptide (TPR) repeat protein
VYKSYEEANGYLQHGDLESISQAIGLFQKALAENPNYTLAQAGIARAYASRISLAELKDSQDRNDAQRACRNALALDSRLASCFVTKGILALSNGTPKPAIAALTNARDLDPSNKEILDWLSKAYDADKNALQAEDTLKSAVSTHPDYWAALNRLGEFYYRHRQYPSAEPLFRSVTKLTPENPLGFSNLGRTYLAEERYEEAEQMLKRALELKPSPDLFFDLGKAYLYKKRYDDAIQMFWKGLELRPNDYQMRRKLGDSMNLSQRDRDAHIAFAACIKSATVELRMHPDDAETLGGKALCLLKNGNRQPAKTLIEQALTKAPRSADVLFAAGVVDAALGDDDRAMKEIKAARRRGYPRSEILNEPGLVRLRNDGRLQEWVDSAGLASSP